MIIYAIEEECIDPYFPNETVGLFQCEEDAKREIDRLKEKFPGRTYEIAEWVVNPEGWVWSE